MIRFKEYLREFRIDRLDDQEKEFGLSQHLLAEEILKTDKFVFHINSHFPISTKMLERVQGHANKPMYAVHITDPNGATNLLTIQNTA